MKVRKLILVALIVLVFLSILINIRPSITGLVTKELAVIDVVVAAEKPLDVEFNFEQSKDSIEKLDKPVYYYLKIRDADFSGMNYFLVKFKVEKDWLRQNGLKNNDIKLYYLGNYWEKSETEVIDEDQDYVYYEAKTDVSSLFAIAVDRVKPVVIKEEEEDKDVLYFAILPLIFISLIGLIGILFSIWLYKRIRYLRIVRVVKNVVYYVSLFAIANVIILFGFSFLKVDGSVVANEVLWFGLIPVLILGLILTLVLHGLVILYKHIKLIRNIIWFVFDYGFIILILSAILYALPARETIVSNVDVFWFGILPLVLISFVVYGLWKLVVRLVYRVWW